MLNSWNIWQLKNCLRIKDMVTEEGRAIHYVLLFLCFFSFLFGLQVKWDIFHLWIWWLYQFGVFFSDANISWVPRLLGFSVKNDPLTGDYFLKMSSGFDFGKTEAHAFSLSHLFPHTALIESKNSHLSGHHLTVSKEAEALGLAHGFSKCSAQTSSISINRELLRKANSWASPQISWTRSSRVGARQSVL